MTITPDDRVAGQIALITGANRGIGRQIALDLAAAGAIVAATARNPETLNDLKAEIETAGGVCDCYALDVTSETAVASAVAQVISRHGQIDLLVNNAGIGAGAERAWDLPVDDWWQVFEVNVRGVYLCSQAVMRQMAKQRSGRIIDVGSLVAANPNPHASSYAASKAALLRWTSCLAVSAAEFGVAVFVISPGLVATDMTDQPMFADIPADQWVPIEKSGELAVALATGRADALTGRFIHALDDLDSMINRAAEISSENMQTLGLRSVSEHY